jgi:hypothetical protein
MIINIEIPDTLDEKEVKECVKIKVERHLRLLEVAKQPSIESVIKPDLDLYDEKNGLKEIELMKDIK